MDPLNIYFTHSKISPYFSGCSKSIIDTYYEVIKDPSTLLKIPVIKLYYDGSNYYSENNRRLYLFKLLRKNNLIREIPYRLEILKGKKLEKFKKNKYSLIAQIKKI